MDIAYLVAYSFIVYRISTDLAYEDGPFELFVHIRTFIYNTFGFTHWVSRGFSCPICISFWLACILAVITRDWLLFATCGITAYLVRDK